MSSSDWSIGGVHVMGTLLLVSTGEGLHDQGMIGTCTQGGGMLVITICCHVHG